MKYDYDFIIIGAGAAGLTAAKTAKGFGRSVCLVEMQKPGGECTHFGCVPSKALIHAATLIQSNVEAKTLSILSGSGKINSNKAFDYARSVIDSVYKTEDFQALRQEGIHAVNGVAELYDRHTVLVDDEQITAGFIVLCTGSRPRIPGIDGLWECEFLTNESIFYLDKAPESMMIIGPGPIGVEMAWAFNKLGTDVTLICSRDAILPREDRQAAGELARLLTRDGVNILYNKKPVRAEQKKNRSILHFSDQSELNAEKLLIAAGRAPHFHGLGLENANVSCDEKQGIISNKYLQTSVPNIFVAGDAAGPYRLSHSAEYQAITAVKNAVLPVKTRVDYKLMGAVVFTSPELASIGLTEEQAEKSGCCGIDVYTHKIKHSDRAITESVDSGLIKVVTDKKGKILGAHILGPRAGELIHIFELSIMKRIKLFDLADMIYYYPTYTDGIKRVARECKIRLLLRNPVIQMLNKKNKGK